jgi:hypothetical protein
MLLWWSPADPWNANRYYSEASKQGTSESLLSLTGGKDGDNTKLASILGPIDEKVHQGGNWRLWLGLELG